MLDDQMRYLLIEHGYQPTIDANHRQIGNLIILGRVSEDTRLLLAETEKHRISESDLHQVFVNTEAEYILIADYSKSPALYRRDPLLESYRPTLFLLRANGTFWGEHSQDELLIPSSLVPILTQAWEQLQRVAERPSETISLLVSLLLLKLIDESNRNQPPLFRLSLRDFDSMERSVLIRQRLQSLASSLPEMDITASIEKLIESGVALQLVVHWQRYNVSAVVQEKQEIFSFLSTVYVAATNNGLACVPHSVSATFKVLMPEHRSGPWLLRTGIADGMMDIALSYPARSWIYVRQSTPADLLFGWLRPEVRFLNQDIIEMNKDSAPSLFNLIVIHPPLGQRITDQVLLSRYNLADRGETGLKQRTQDASVLYLEQAYHLLQPGGWLLVLLSDGVLSNASLRYVREWLEAHFRLLAVVSLPTNVFTPIGVSLKTSVVCLQKWSDTPLDDYPIFMSELQGETDGTISRTELDDLGEAYRKFCEENNESLNSKQI
jgi:hypothetical protein